MSQLFRLWFYLINRSYFLVALDLYIALVSSFSLNGEIGKKKDSFLCEKVHILSCGKHVWTAKHIVSLNNNKMYTLKKKTLWLSETL